MKAYIEAFVVFIIITLPFSFLIGIIISLVAYSNTETRWKADQLSMNN